jgi:hypothetical protein
LGIAGGGSAIAGGVLLVVAIGNRQISGGLLLLAVFGILSLGEAWYAFGCASAGLLVADDVVVIRNPAKKREVPISDVLRFTAGQQPSGYGNPTPGVMLELHGGRAYPVWTLAREGFVWNSSGNVAAWVAAADSLNELLRPAS